MTANCKRNFQCLPLGLQTKPCFCHSTTETHLSHFKATQLNLPLEAVDRVLIS